MSVHHLLANAAQAFSDHIAIRHLGRSARWDAFADRVARRAASLREAGIRPGERTGAENVFAGEVESALMYHEAVQAAAVIGVPDSTWGESVHAVVVLKPGHTPSEAALIEHCRARIARYKCPRTVTFRAALPLSGVGKVRKVDLLAEWKQAQTNAAN
jgi:acyl-CoA synthetase (AMP-forming)/AMP-acid ligase II